MLKTFLGKFSRMGNLQKNDMTKRATRQRRKTREEIGKGIQMTALRFQTPA